MVSRSHMQETASAFPLIEIAIKLLLSGYRSSRRLRAGMVAQRPRCPDLHHYQPVRDVGCPDSAFVRLYRTGWSGRIKEPAPARSDDVRSAARHIRTRRSDRPRSCIHADSLCHRHDALVALKPQLSRFAGGLAQEEVRGAILLGLIGFVIYPVLPNRFVDPWNLLNPREAGLR